MSHYLIDMKTFPTLHTPRLTLGQIEVSDIPVITAYASNPNVSKKLRTMPYPYAEKDAIFWLNKARTEFEEETAYIFRVGLTATGEFIGGISLHIKKEHQKAVIGYWIGCLLYTSPSPRDLSTSRMPSSA